MKSIHTLSKFIAHWFEGRTIENYFIESALKKRKSLLTYGPMTLSQLAYELIIVEQPIISKQFLKILLVLTPLFLRKWVCPPFPY